MGMLKEFKEFAVKGNLVDLAVAFVMGAAFVKVTSSFIEGIVMPFIGMLTGGVNFNDKVWVLKEGSPAVKNATGAVTSPEVAAVAIKYGTFITNVFDFIVVAFCMFLVIKAINKMKKAEPAPEPAPPQPSTTDKLLAEIRDALREK